MKILARVILAIVVFLAIFSGISKVMLMEQEVEFFGSYGFSNATLIGFGVLQLLGGCLLIFRRTQLVGAGIVAITFLTSAVLLIMEGNIPVSIFTFVALLMLGFVVRQNLGSGVRALFWKRKRSQK